MSELMKKMELLWGMPIFFTEDKEQLPQSFGAFLEKESPFVSAKQLTRQLIGRSEQQNIPVIYKDQNNVYFICVKAKKGFYLIGPVCTERMDYVQIHQFYRCYDITASEERHPMQTTLMRILTFAGVLYELENGTAVSAAELLRENNLIKEEEMETEKEEMILEMRMLDDELYHHTYQEERYVMESVREGKPIEARQRMAALIDYAGVLSDRKLNHYRNLAITLVTVSAREAIAGGVSPAKAYRLSDVYINKIDKCAKIEALLEYNKTAIYDFSKMVADTKLEKTSCSYTEQCKDYIYKNYHRKIRLEDVADSIGISQGHLSRVFHQDMGMSVQDYIQKFRVERAANLLKYSEASLSEISDYVCFHSQSHFGSVFKKFMHMTPKQYRDKYKEREFRSSSQGA